MDALNYVLFTNPISQTAIGGASAVLKAAGIKPKSQSQTIIREVMQPFQGNRMYIRLAGVAGATATIMASVGAHRQFPNENDETLRKNYETANRFHFFGALGLIAVPFTRFPHLTGLLMTSGTILFCGPTYYRALTGDTKKKAWNRLTPIGGAIVIAAWVSMIL